MNNLTHYIIGFIHNGEPCIHDDWLELIDIGTDEGAAQVKMKLLHDFLGLNDHLDALKLDCFDNATLREAVGRPKPSQAGDKADDAIILSRQIRRWDVEEGTTDSLPNEPEYDLVVKYHGSQLGVEITPAGLIEPDEIKDLPQLSLTIEINNGLPCVHIHSDIYGDLAQSIFAAPNNQLEVRPGDASQMVNQVYDNYEPDIARITEQINKMKMREPAIHQLFNGY